MPNTVKDKLSRLGGELVLFISMATMVSEQNRTVRIALDMNNYPLGKEQLRAHMVLSGAVTDMGTFAPHGEVSYEIVIPAKSVALLEID